jgi:hypothetical protein
MIKRGILLLMFSVCLISLSGPANAALTTIGTAVHDGTTSNLIYDSVQRLVWLDYTKESANWPDQLKWAAGLNSGGSISYTLNPGINIVWDGVWRLPETMRKEYSYGFDGTTSYGYNITTSEMGNLYYKSLGNRSGYDTSGNLQSGAGLLNKGPFTALQAYDYWSCTASQNSYYGNFFGFSSGFLFASLGITGTQAADLRGIFGPYRPLYGLAVRRGHLSSAVPNPPTRIDRGLR